jgi:hypothetical protein
VTGKIKWCKSCGQKIDHQSYMVEIRRNDDGTVLQVPHRWGYVPDAGFNLNVEGTRYRVDRVTTSGTLKIVWVNERQAKSQAAE